MTCSAIDPLADPSPPPRRVFDDDGAAYALERLLGSGAQGQVFAVAGGRFAVKLLRDTSDAQRRRCAQQLRFLRSLGDRLRDIPIAHPLALLKPPALGYVMSLCPDMHSLSTLIARAPADPLAWYRDSGGLRRRLRLLARLASALGDLHALGLAYGDLSPGNVLIAAAPEADAVSLIDSDNLLFEGQPGAPAFYTPDYGAPELVSGRGAPSSLSDAHAFAVLAHQVLRLCHPLKGDAVEDGPPELEEQALRGALPWIDDPDDDRNRCSRGLPADLMLTRSLRELCQQCFGPGLRAPRERPSLSRWSERLTRAADLCLRCCACGWTWLALPKIPCPACDAPRPLHALLQVLRYDPEAPSQDQHLLRPSGVTLPAYTLEQDAAPTVTAHGEWQLVREHDAPRLRVRALPGDPPQQQLFLDSAGAVPQPLTRRSLYLSLDPPLVFHLVRSRDELSLPHRVLRASLEREGAR